jgi:hypothetical protein
VVPQEVLSLDWQKQNIIRIKEKHKEDAKPTSEMTLVEANPR